MVRVLVTRPEPGATATARRLAEAGHEAVILPLSEIRPLGPALPSSGEIDIVAATSANALRHLPPTQPALFARPCYAVGGKTAQAARLAGFVDIRATHGDGAALAAMIAAEEPEGTRILYPCGRVRRPEFEQALGHAAMNVMPVEVYDTIFVQPRPEAIALAAAGRPIHAVLLYSPETARATASILALQGPGGVLAEASLLCLSAQVADALGTLGDPRTYVSIQPTEDGLLALLPRD